MHDKFRLFVSCVLVCVLLGACSAGTRTRVILHSGLSSNEIFRVDNLVCTKPEMLVYLANAENQYMQSLGALKAGQGADGQDAFSGVVKENALALASQVKAMQLLAADVGVTLEAADEDRAAAAAAAYYDSLTDADLKLLVGITQNQLRQMYQEVALANRVYAYTIRDVNPEISDDEARTITVEQIRVDKAADAAAAYEIIAEAAARIAGGEDFANVLPDYNEAESARVSFGLGMGGGIPEEAAFSLDSGETSDILETEDAYYLLRCVSSFDREQTRANKSVIVEQRRHETFGTVYDEFIAGLPVQLNEKAWEALDIPADSGSTTASFWQFYDEFFQ